MYVFGFSQHHRENNVPRQVSQPPSYLLEQFQNTTDWLKIWLLVKKIIESRTYIWFGCKLLENAFGLSESHEKFHIEELLLGLFEDLPVVKKNQSVSLLLN